MNTTLLFLLAIALLSVPVTITGALCLIACKQRATPPPFPFPQPVNFKPTCFCSRCEKVIRVGNPLYDICPTCEHTRRTEIREIMARSPRNEDGTVPILHVPSGCLGH